MFSESKMASRACDWEELVIGVRRQCRAFTLNEISPYCEVNASWLDEHSVEIRWSKGQISRAIQILLVGDSWPLEVRVSGSASIEPPKGPDDFKWWNGVKAVQVTDPDDLELLLDRQLPVAARQVSALME